MGGSVRGMEAGVTRFSCETLVRTLNLSESVSPPGKWGYVVLHSIVLPEARTR